MLSSDSEVLVACREFVEPPSGDMPNAIVIASTNVDLPAPLFPTRTVYAPSCKPLLSSSRTAGIEQGQAASGNVIAGSPPTRRNGRPDSTCYLRSDIRADVG